MPICKYCGAIVKNLNKHYKRKRCVKHKGYNESKRKDLYEYKKYRQNE